LPPPSVPQGTHGPSHPQAASPPLAHTCPLAVAIAAGVEWGTGIVKAPSFSAAPPSRPPPSALHHSQQLPAPSALPAWTPATAAPGKPWPSTTPPEVGRGVYACMCARVCVCVCVCTHVCVCI
jgi:hypothetical protein